MQDIDHICDDMCTHGPDTDMGTDAQILAQMILAQMTICARICVLAVSGLCHVCVSVPCHCLSVLVIFFCARSLCFICAVCAFCAA